MATIPHLDLPFRILSSRRAAVVEQDSESEIENCVETILRYTHGDRPERPTFGIPDLTFSFPNPSVPVITDWITQWEPRTTMVVGDPVIDKIRPLIQKIVVEEGNG